MPDATKSHGYYMLTQARIAVAEFDRIIAKHHPDPRKRAKLGDRLLSLWITARMKSERRLAMRIVDRYRHCAEPELNT